jgi:hypothetical protein
MVPLSKSGLRVSGAWVRIPPSPSKEVVEMSANCENCKFRNYAERKPNSLISKIWRWHTKWCPGWKAYQAELAEQEAKES